MAARRERETARATGQDWTPLTVDQVIRTALLLDGSSCCKCRLSFAMQMLSFVCLDISCKHNATIPPPCTWPGGGLLLVMRRPLFFLFLVCDCDCRNFAHSRYHHRQHPVTYIATTQHLISIISRQVINHMASIFTLSLVISSHRNLPSALRSPIQPAHNGTLLDQSQRGFPGHAEG